MALLFQLIFCNEGGEVEEAGGVEWEVCQGCQRRNNEWNRFKLGRNRTYIVGEFLAAVVEV